MKNIMLIVYAGILLAAIASITGCSQEKKSEQAESGELEHSEMMKESESHHYDASDEDQHSGHDAMAIQEMGDNKVWTPGSVGDDLIMSDFHFLTGNTENIKPEVKEVDGSQVLELTTDGSPVAFVFHNQYGNLGMIATLKRFDFNGNIKVIHHAKDLANHDYVSINGNHMKLGRVVKGVQKVFDEQDFSAVSGWIPLKVTAAGTHYKGYIGEQTITHGHGDKMENGYIGILLEGTGKVQIKSIETVALEDE